MNYIVYPSTIFISCILFLAIILSLAIPPSHTRRVLLWIAALTAAAALGLYGFGYGYQYLQPNTTDTLVTSILRTVLTTCRIFTGANDWDRIKAAYAGHPFWEISFWLVHLLAVATSASVVITSLGSTLLKKIRLRLIRRRDISLIYGLNENTLSFGQELAEKTNSAILYVAKDAPGELSSAVEQMGALMRCDTDAVNGTLRFVKSIGLRCGKRRLRVFALDRSVNANLQYAQKLRGSLQQRGILAVQTSLTILADDDETDNPLQNSVNQFGYGSVITVNEPELIARLLVHRYPPHKTLTFDAVGKAVSDFHAVILGFGQIGQAVLQQLVMNSQFHGCESRIAVFAPDYEQQMGSLSHKCSGMLDHYHISLFPYDGRSRQFYDYIAAHIASINYVAICAGNEAINQEISTQLYSFLRRKKRQVPILMCNSNSVLCQNAVQDIAVHRIYTPELLCADQIDRMAMVPNQNHRGQGDPLENWHTSQYFDRVSSRASADFYAALLHCAGVTPEKALEHWDPQGELLENLSINEHLRWNAFHFCAGFRPMTEAEFEQRAATYRIEKAKDPQTTYRIAKDMEQRIHACLIPWEELDAYSQKESAVTGEYCDYKEYDRKNVRELPSVLHATEQETRKKPYRRQTRRKKQQ